MDLHELVELVRVCESPAYRTIIADLTENIESLAQQIEQSRKADIDAALIGEWKATRKIVRQLAQKRDEYRAKLDEHLSVNPSSRAAMASNRTSGISVV